MRKSKLQERRSFIRDEVKKYKSTTTAVRDISNKLFLSERTVWNDLEKSETTAKTDKESLKTS